jgi:hypothetical protein
MQLKFTVQNQRIARADTEKPVAGSVGYLTAAFTFTVDWTNLIKTAIFRAGTGTPYEVQLDANDECDVATQAIASGTMYVSVRGDSITGDTVFLPTTAYPIQIYPAGATSGIAPTAAEPVTNADTAYTFTGTDTVNKSEIVLLQTEVNELKAVLRAFKLITEE